MKLNDIKPTVESGGEFQEQFFSIQDTGMIFDILRNKMYSNPIGAICREISCNARDAHREVGKQDLPVEIYLPNSLEPFYKIKDFGPGISPDRMANIFVQYTASTKRNDNIQTGGFGLGAKTPFSYSDSFVVITRYNGIKYRYNAYIDPTKVGKMSLAGQEETDEANGTEIIIPVKSADFNAFATGTVQACKHWTVQPKIFGGNVDFTFGLTIAEGKGWKIVSKNVNNPNNHYYNHSYSAKEIKLIVDGVEYPLDLNQLKNYSSNNILSYIHGDVFLYFGIGELSLAASRESVYLDKETQKKISTSLDTVLQELKKSTIDKINAIPTLWDAWTFAHEELRGNFANLGFLGTLEWNGIAIKTDGYLSICPNYHDQNKVLIYKKGAWSRKLGNQPDKIERSGSREITFKKNTVLYLNDLGVKEPGVKHVKKLFDNDPKLETVQVVCPGENVKIADLVAKYSLKELGGKYLSSITTAKKYKPASQRVLTFRYEQDSAQFKQVAYSVFEEDTKTKVLAKLRKDNFMNGRHAILKDSKGSSRDVESRILNILLNSKNISIYGVDAGTPEDRIEEDFEDTLTLQEFVDNFFKNKTVDFVKIKHCVGTARTINSPLNSAIGKIAAKIDKDTVFYKYHKTCTDIVKTVEVESKLLTLYEAYFKQVDGAEVKDWLVNNPDWDLQKIMVEFNNKYPLIAHINSYDYEKAMPNIVDYVKLVENN